MKTSALRLGPSIRQRLPTGKPGSLNDATTTETTAAPTYADYLAKYGPTKEDLRSAAKIVKILDKKIDKKR